MSFLIGGPNLLPSITLEASCAATSLNSNGLSVSKHSLYEKKEYEKAVSKHLNGFEQATSRGLARKPALGFEPGIDPLRSPPEPVHQWRVATSSGPKSLF